MIGTLDWDIRARGKTLVVTDGNLNMSTTAVPAIAGTVVVPHDEAVFQALDPRSTQVPRVTLNGHRTEWAAQTVGDVSAYFLANTATTVAGVSALWSGLPLTSVSDLFGKPLWDGAAFETSHMELSLHVREIETDGFAMTITVASDEALLLDWGPSSNADITAMADQSQSYPDNIVSTWVNLMMRIILKKEVIPGPYDSTAMTDSNLVQATGAYAYGKNAWDFFRPALDDTNLKLWPTPDGRGMTLQRPNNSIKQVLGLPDSSHLFTPADVISARTGYTRSGDWYDSSLLFRPNAEGSSFGYPRGSHSKTYMEDFRGRIPSQSMAQNIVTRASNRGAYIDIVAPIRPNVFMTDEFTYLPDGASPGPDYQWRVLSVNFGLTSGTMTIRGERRY